jgi:hypothetical protein
MAYPFRPSTNEDLDKLSTQIKNLIYTLKNSKQHIVLTYPKEKIRIKNKATVFKKNPMSPHSKSI